MTPEQRVYRKFCGAKLKRDAHGLYCPTRNCQWRYGADELDDGDRADDAQERKEDR